jgi:nucleotide-binding universal stress UspA family protein
MVGPSRLLSDYFVAASKEAEKVVEEVVRLAEIDNVKATSLILQNVFSTVEAIVTQAANKDVDLIVVGTRGLSGFRKLLLGSVSSGVVTHAHCSVLVVR